METVFMNFAYRKTSDLHRLLLNLSDRINLKRSNKHVALSNLENTTHGKVQKSHVKIINLKYQLRLGMKNLKLPYELYYVLDIQGFSECIFKKHKIFNDNPPIKNVCE